MALLLNVNNDAGVPLQYHEITALHWDNTQFWATILVSSWLTSSGRDTLPPVETNALTINGPGFVEFSQTAVAAPNILAEAELVLKSQTPAVSGHWFLTADWSSATHVPSQYISS